MIKFTVERRQVYVAHEMSLNLPQNSSPKKNESNQIIES